MAVDIVIFGHSFVTKLRNFSVENGDSNLRLDKEKFRIFMHGVSGLNLKHAPEESDVVVNLSPQIIILELGANDLDSRACPDPHQIAHAIFDFAQDLLTRSNANKIIISMVFPRSSPRRRDFNDQYCAYNAALHDLCANSHQVFSHPHQNMMSSWQDLLQDGVHFNKVGLPRYFRSIRGACFKSVKDLHL